MSAPVPPSYKDLGKAANDLLGKDYPLGTQTLECKTRAPNGVLFKGAIAKDDHRDAILGEVEGKYLDAKNGVALTQTWLTNNTLKTQLEIENQLAKGLKFDLVGTLNPDKGAKSALITAIYRQPAFHGRAIVDPLNGPTITTDAVFGQDGFLAGVDVKVDSQGQPKSYSAALGYSAPEYSVTLRALNALTAYQASYYHRVNRDTEAGAIALYKTDKPNNVDLQVGAKTYLDAAAFIKAKVNNSGIVTLGYTQALRPGVKASFGLALDTVKLSQKGQSEKPVAPADAAKVGASFTFES